MAVLDELQESSFRGISFLFRRSTTTGGRKNAKHEYPLSNRRYIEDLGEFRKTFAMEAIITSPNYFQKRDALIEALTKEGAGVLVHPTFGSVDVFLASPYSLDEDLSGLGEARFTLDFQETDLNILPEDSLDTRSNIVDNVATALDDAETALPKNYKNPSRIISNFNDAKAKVTGFLDKANNIATKIRTVGEQLTEFNNSLIQFRSDINRLITTPADLAASVTNLFQNMQLLATNPVDQFALFEGLYNFGQDDDELEVNTVQRQDRQTNRDVLNDTINSNTLALSYQAALDIDYRNSTDIDLYRGNLENQYLLLVAGDVNADGDILEGEATVDFTLKERIQLIRSDIEIFYATLEKTIPNVVQIDTKMIPISVLAYDYYGSIDNVLDILGINLTDNVSFLEGEINILQ